jgi:hypothetical protein
MKWNKKIIVPLALLPVWYLLYHYLQPITDWFIDTVLGLEKGAHFTESLRFFVFEVPKVMMLLALIILFARTSRQKGHAKYSKENRPLLVMYWLRCSVLLRLFARVRQFHCFWGL